MNSPADRQLHPGMEATRHNQPWRSLSLMEYVNAQPRGYFLADMAVNGLVYVGKTAYEVYRDPAAQLELSRRMSQVFPTDFSYSLCDGIIFCEEVGLEILKPDYDFPSVLSHTVTCSADVARLPRIDPHTATRMSCNLRSLALIADTIDLPLYVSIQGPFTLATQLAGATHLLRCIVSDRSFVDELLAYTGDLVKRYALAVQKAGAQLISLAEPASVTLDTQRFHDLVVNNLNSIYDSLDCWKSLHICGDTSEFLDEMLSCHLNAVSLDQIMDYRQVIKRIPDNIVLLGNLDPVELLSTGTPKQIRGRTFNLRSSMLDHPNHVCAFGCNCTNDSPEENLQAAFEVGRMDNADIRAFTDDKNRALRFLGYNRAAGRLPSAAVEAIVDEEVLCYQDYLEPFICALDLDELPAGEREAFERTLGLGTYPHMQKTFDAAQDIYLMAYSAGSLLGEVIAGFSASSDMMRGLVVDKLAVVGLDHLRDSWVADTGAASGYELLHAFYPGYAPEFPLEKQNVLYGLLVRHKKELAEHIRIDPVSAQMSPVKSVIGLFCFGPRKQPGRAQQD